MTAANINWSDIAYLANNARALVANVSTILSAVNTLNSVIGTSSDTGTTTLFGMTNTVLAAVQNIQTGSSSETITSILDGVNVIQSALGSTTDASSTASVFGNLTKITDYVQNLKTAVGTSTDTTASTTVFGSLAKLTDLQNSADKAKSNASSAMDMASHIREELGAQGKTQNTYDSIKKLDESLNQLHTAAQAISQSQVDSGKVAQEMIGTLSNFVNESAKAAGLSGGELDVKPLNEKEATDQQKVYGKLDEINAKLNALKEATESESDNVVVKSWFEGGQ